MSKPQQDTPYKGQLKRTWYEKGYSEGYQRGLQDGIRQVGKWIKLPYRRGMKISKNIDGTGGLVNAGCEVCGGKLVYIRSQYPKGKRRKVCPTCATETLESLYSNCNNRDAYQESPELRKKLSEKVIE